MELRTIELPAPLVEGHHDHDVAATSVSWAKVGGELAPDHDETLSVMANTVTWSSHARTVLIATVPANGGPVLQTCFAYFADFRTSLLQRRRYACHPT